MYHLYTTIRVSYCCGDHTLTLFPYTDVAITVSLTLKDNSAEGSVVTSVAREIFSDGLLNWGRLVSLVAFGATLLGTPKAIGPEPDRAHEIGVSIAAYITDNHMDWFVDNEDWVCSVSTQSRQLVMGSPIIKHSPVCVFLRPDSYACSTMKIQTVHLRWQKDCCLCVV